MSDGDVYFATNRAIMPVLINGQHFPTHIFHIPLGQVKVLVIFIIIYKCKMIFLAFKIPQDFLTILTKVDCSATKQPTSPAECLLTISK